MSDILTRIYNFTGFRDKTLWDWMALLIVPAILGVGVIAFNTFQESREKIRLQEEQKSAAERAEARERFDREIEADRVKEAVLQGYFDRMTELLLDKRLRESQPGDITRNVARARTVTTITQLGEITQPDTQLGEITQPEDVTLPGDRIQFEDRRTALVVFLKESGLINAKGSIVDLSGADLLKVNLRNKDLTKVNLSDTQMTKASLEDAVLDNSILRSVNLFEAILIKVHAWCVDFTDASLESVIAWESDLRGAIFKDAKLANIDLSESDLSFATFSGAVMNDAYLEDVILSGADMSGANLLSAEVTDEQLAQTRSLVGATMPDGTIMTEEMWPVFQAKYGGEPEEMSDESEEETVICDS